MDKTKIYLGVIVLIIILISGFIYAKLNHKDISDNIPKNSASKQVKNTCNSTIEEITLNGQSMEPLIKDGTTVKYYSGYYDCDESSISKGDVIIYNFAITKKIIKQVKAVEGDSFSFTGGKIYVNNEVLKNSDLIEYNLSSKMLELYARDYPILPKDTALILGDDPAGSIDSSKFGLVSIRDFAGKVILE